MQVHEFTEQEQEQILLKYSQLAFANLKKNILQDLINNKNESSIYKRYSKEEIVKVLSNPQRSEEQTREISRYIYLISSHYRRLVSYYATILLYNYSIIPTKIPYEKPKKTEYKKCYYDVVNQAEKYNLKHEASKAMEIAVRDGVFYGICYESEDSFYIRHFTHTKYMKISSIEDGVYRPSIDMAYFTGREDLLLTYGQNFADAYYAYKGDKEKRIKGDKKKKWYEIPNGIVIKADESDPYYSFPLFLGLLDSIFDIEDYRMLNKAKAENDNYKVLSAKMETDDDGVPKMDFSIAQKYYGQMSQNLPAGIGLLLSPFEVDDFSFQTSTASDRNNVVESINTFWQGAGTPSSLFGGGNISSSSAMMMAVKPDEALAFSMLKQFERFFNYRIKKMNLKYRFKISFSMVSIFNQDEYANRISKAASLGVPVKLEYCQVLGLSPSDVLGLTYLEEDILSLSKKVWLSPLVSSNTQSSINSDIGRPSSEQIGESISDSNQNTRDSNANDNR